MLLMSDAQMKGSVPVNPVISKMNGSSNSDGKLSKLSSWCQAKWAVDNALSLQGTRDGPSLGPTPPTKFAQSFQVAADEQQVVFV